MAAAVVESGVLPDRLVVEVNTRGAGLGAPTGLSPSSLSKFNQCELAYYFYAVARIGSAPTADAVRGTFVHSVLERLMALPPTERTLDRARRLASEARAELGDNEDWVALGLDADQTREWMWAAWKSICAYFQLEDPTGVTVASVEGFHSAVVDGVPLRGITDRVDRTNDGLVVTDYKSGRTPRNGWSASRMRQAHFYAVLIEAVTGERPVRVRLMFVNGTEPATIVAQTRDSMVADIRREVVKVWAGIQDRLRSGLFEAKPSRLCDWCDHKAYCPAFGGDLHDSPVEAVTQIQQRLC